MNAFLHLTEEEKQAIAEIKARVMLLAGKSLKGLYLFGSKARGDYHTDSDVDIAIIVEGLTRETKKSIIDIVADAEVENFVVISALVLPEADFRLLLERERRIALDIEREGIAI